MNSFMKIKKNAKALSPVVASIILIAVTVAVSVVVAAWMGGMTTGLMGSAEQASIVNIAFTHQAAANDMISATVLNSGDAAVTIKNAFVNGLQVVIADTDSSTGSLTLTKGQSATITLDMGSGTYLSAGSQYQVKFITAKGNSIVNTQTYNNPT